MPVQGKFISPSGWLLSFFSISFSCRRFMSDETEGLDIYWIELTGAELLLHVPEWAWPIHSTRAALTTIYCCFHCNKRLTFSLSWQSQASKQPHRHVAWLTCDFTNVVLIRHSTFIKWCMFLKKCFVFCLQETSANNILANGLVQGHAYTVTGVKQVKNFS